MADTFNGMEQRGHDRRRPYAVVKDLTDLTGPRHGVVELPLRLDWSTQHRRYDLDHDDDRRLLYETVLNQALRPEDLHNVLNTHLLIELWPRLWLPTRVRELWERRFPQLVAQRIP